MGHTLEQRPQALRLESHRRGHHRRGSARPRSTDPLDQFNLGPLAGIITGIGFIGGGLILKSGDDQVRGVTTAATVFATAVVGLVVGLGHLLIAGVVTALVLLVLELRFIPGLRYLDARSYRGRLLPDRDTAGQDTAGTGGDTPHP